MHFSALDLAVTFANLLLGLAVATSAAFVYDRSKAAAGFLGLAGLAYMLGELVQIAMRPMWLHAERNLVSLLSVFVSGGRNLVFFGGLALALRAIAVANFSQPERRA